MDRRTWRDAGRPKEDCVRRSLFGPVDHDRVQATLRKELATINVRDSRRWNFDFQKEEPLEGRYSWSPTGDGGGAEDVAGAQRGVGVSGPSGTGGTSLPLCAISENNITGPTVEEGSVQVGMASPAHPAANCENALLQGSHRTLGAQLAAPSGGNNPMISAPEAYSHSPKHSAGGSPSSFHSPDLPQVFSDGREVAGGGERSTANQQSVLVPALHRPTATPLHFHQGHGDLYTFHQQPLQHNSHHPAFSSASHLEDIRQQSPVAATPGTGSVIVEDIMAKETGTGPLAQPTPSVPPRPMHPQPRGFSLSPPDDAPGPGYSPDVAGSRSSVPQPGDSLPVAPASEGSKRRQAHVTDYFTQQKMSRFQKTPDDQA